MEKNYKIIISNRNIYKEIELPAQSKEFHIGTNIGCNYRLHKSLFFEPIELTLINNNGNWSMLCSDSIYLTIDDSRKLISTQLTHGSICKVKYQSSDNAVFDFEFLIDFDDHERRYERYIDISNSNELKIGSNTVSQIHLKSPYVIDDDIILRKSNDEEFRLLVNSSTYGVYHNGAKVSKECIIKNRDFFSISDFVFYFQDGILWTEIRDDIKLNNISFVDQPYPVNYPKFKRNTRLKTILNKDKIEVLDPPAKPQKNKSNLFVSLLPSLGMLLTSGLMASMGGSMIIFSVVSGGMAVITAIVSAIQNSKDFKKESRERIEKYKKYADNKRIEITEYRNTERQERESIYVDQASEEALLHQYSCELFDRQIGDDDFLNVRLGTGGIKPARKIEYKHQEKLEVDDELQTIPENISKEFSILNNAPVICDLKACNSIGIIGNEDFRFSLLKNMIIDLCTRHYPTDIKLFFIAEQFHRNKVNWLRFLPNVYNEITNTRNIVCDDDSRNVVFDYLFKELSQRTPETVNEHLIVFFYDEYGFQSHPISKFIGKLKELNATFVFMAEDKGEIPQGCSYIINMKSTTDGTLINSSDQKERTDFHFNEISDTTAKHIVNLLAPIYTDEISLEASLTKNISMFDMLNILSVEDLDLEHRWSSSTVSKSMAAPIGVTKTGVISLDLHDRAHGPHGLVAGTTGSGKSEVLQTFILSVATLYHPYEIAFVIIDFKGGGMVNQFKELPHLLGSITNIDGKQIDRSLKSIKAELRKRQQLFADADVNHINKYIKKYKAGEVKTPIPHLVLIVDEFAELKSEQPEFMKELISAARIGRSLGVHLILATQKPSGQVDEQIWSNSKFKLCLKVQSPEDSNEVIKSPLAAEIKEPGRAYLQVGNNEVFELFQSAYSGAPESIEESSVKEFVINEVSDSGKRYPIYIQKKNNTNSTGITQLDAIVDYVSEFCDNKKISRLPNICLPSLPERINYPDSDNYSISQVNIGLYDDPDNQIQGSAFINLNNNTLIIGSSQTGKTNLLQGMIRTLSANTSPLETNIYIIDFGSMVLKNFETLKHVGGVVCSAEDEKLKNLFKLLFAEISSRKEKLVSSGVSSFASYLEAGNEDMPHIYLFVDNITALMELYLEDDDSLLNIIREGVSVGITTIVANAQTSGIGYKYLSNFSNKIAFYCNDSSEYINVFDHATIHPDNVQGRCVFESDKQVLECQTYIAFDGEREIERVNHMKTFMLDVNAKHGETWAKAIPYIPTILDINEMWNYIDGKAKAYKVPIGLTYSDVEPFYLDLSQLGIMGICGKENTGHRNFVKLLLSWFETHNTLLPVKITVFDDVDRKLDFIKSNPLVEKYTLDTSLVKETLESWYDILEKRYNNLLEDGNSENDSELLLMIVQNNDVAKFINDDFDLLDKFNEIMSRFKGLNVAFLFTNFVNASLPFDAPEPLRQIKQDQHIIYFEDLDNLKPFEVPYEDIRANRKKLESGDAYYIRDNMVIKLKLVKSEH